MKRLAALLIALAVGAAPGVVEICQLACASRSMHSHTSQTADAHAMHHGGDESKPSCHETDTVAYTVASPSVPCNHGDAASAPSLATTRPDGAAPAPVHVAIFDSADTIRASFADRGRAVPPIDRLELRLSSPLRI